MNKGFVVPDNIRLHDYQLKAIEQYADSGFRGIFDMATGTGKTFTGLGALAKLTEHTCGNIFVVIVCPYQHLVEQWVQDINAFGVKPLICYSKYDYKDKLKRLVDGIKLNANLGIAKFGCVITTNATFGTDYFQEQLLKLTSRDSQKCINSCLVVDEAHNFGAVGLRRVLFKHNFAFRLALSATLDRHGDQDGTSALYTYFGSKCIEYGLRQAIDNDFLTPYKYYPIVVPLDVDELEEFVELTNEIVRCLSQCGAFGDDGKLDSSKLSDRVKILLIKRARIVAGAKNKIDIFKHYIMPYRDKNNILVYCGATKVEYDEERGINDVKNNSHANDVEEQRQLRQIECITKLMGNDLNMKVRKYTSQESVKEREQIKKSFCNTNLQAIVAIRCLDEGVNIPSISTAFLLASSTNPKEYIQRRGRVLRKWHGKHFAEIFDFVVVPRELDSKQRPVDQNAELSLIKRELARVEEFRDMAINPQDSFKVYDSIQEYYKTNLIQGVDYGF